MKFGILKKLNIKYFLNYEVWNSTFYILSHFDGTSVFGQFHKKKNRPLVELDGTYKMSHFYISPGLTFMLPNEMERLGESKMTPLTLEVD